MFLWSLIMGCIALICIIIIGNLFEYEIKKSITAGVTMSVLLSTTMVNVIHSSYQIGYAEIKLAHYEVTINGKTELIQLTEEQKKNYINSRLETESTKILQQKK